MNSPSGLCSSPGSSGLSLYDDSSTTFLPVVIVDVDEDPAENIELLPVRGPILAMLPGPSAVRSLILIEEEVDINSDVQFIPPHFRGDDTAGPDVPQEEEEEVKELECKVAGTPEFWAGDYLE